MRDTVRRALRAAAWPLAGLAATYVVLLVTPWGRRLDTLSYHGRWGTGWTARAADLALLQTVSIATVGLALVTLVVVAGLRGRWQLGLRAAVGVAGAIVTAETLKLVLPSLSARSGDWRWLTIGSFPSGHAVVVTSIALAALSVSNRRWRRLLVGPLVAWTALATTATVTVGWHRPSDVIGSLFLATAWHRACTAGLPSRTRLRTLIPRPALPAWRARIAAIPRPSGPAVSWWAFACLLVLGAAVEGVLTGRSTGRITSLAYLGSLAVMLAGAGLTVAAMADQPSRRPVPVPVRARRLPR